MNISFEPETEDKLRQESAATGKDIPTLVREAVEEKLATSSVSFKAPETYDRWVAEFQAWMRDVETRRSLYPQGYEADDSRETIYEDREE